MCSEEIALLAAIVTHPDEDDPRLRYSDWLQEHGRDERAEFIRVQIARPRRDEVAGLPGEMTDRERELLGVLREGACDELPNCVAWFGPCPSRKHYEMFRPMYERGFPSVVTCTTVDWIPHGDAICAQQPIRAVLFTDWPDIEQGTLSGHLALVGDPLSRQFDEVDIFRIGAERVPPHTTDTPASAAFCLLHMRWPGVAFCWQPTAKMEPVGKLSLDALLADFKQLGEELENKNAAALLSGVTKLAD